MTGRQKPGCAFRGQSEAVHKNTTGSSHFCFCPIFKLLNALSPGACKKLAPDHHIGQTDAGIYIIAERSVLI